MRRAIDWAFRDRRTGAITVAQWPNLPLWLFAGTSLADWILNPPGTVAWALRLIAGASLAWWAIDELLRGVNPWRRFLGAAALAGQALVLATAGP
ncbi:hypothetical protein F6X51_18265 [Methylobacterium planeticum]|uniref:Uncharacterized protein n=1 Tax=Methylobacterium planeticum TaxID=2615211 RepID=A0A6N6MNQ8_9HYPH|nr:hypothetical protein F6X51_18265 [Methylobacterium planeticum]